MDSVNAPGFRQEMQEGRMERSVGRNLLIAFAGVLLFGGLIVVGRIFQLQLVRGDSFLARAKANKTYPILIQAPRGIFYDRKYTRLVENIPTFVITLSTKAIADDETFQIVLARLEALTGRSRAEIAESNGADLQARPAEELASRASWPGDMFIASGELRDAILEIESRPEDFPGATITEAGRREYPLAGAASHLLGFVGQPSREDLAKRTGVKPSDVIGKSGLELQYGDFLQGQAGEKLIEIDAAGKPQRERFIQKAVPGENVVLEIDADLQRFAAETLGRHIRALGKKAGALVALDPRDGALRALVSYPNFDANVFGAPEAKKEVNELLKNPVRPFFNRAVSGGYPSASTIKPLLATAALEERIIDPDTTIFDPGYILVPNPFDPSKPTIFKDWRALGTIDMRRAIAMSANVYFYTIGGGYSGIKGLGIERIKKYLERFGWGSPLGVDLPGEYAGLIPDPEKKKTIRPKDPIWRIGDTYITSIGQGDLQITPLQLADAIAAIANGGTLWRPRIAKAVVDSDRRTLQEFRPEAIRTDLADPASLQVVREGMRQAVTSGSATALNDLFFTVAGKTGTAQTGAYGKNHGWFVGFAPYETPELVIAVLVEEGTGGSSDAVPIAKEVLYYYFTHARDANNPPLTTRR